MATGTTCEHLNKVAELLNKELWDSKEALACFDCGCLGPNLWICLQPDCHHIGCSEVKNDHSTIHQKNFPSHCVHMNVTTERIWCYACEKEVHIRAALAYNRIAPDSTSFVGGSSGVPRLSFDQGVALNVSLADDEEDPDESDYGEDDESRPRGLIGLQNMGNTCYMNAALQALSNTAPLTSYFLQCAPVVALLLGDKKPAISRAYQKLIKEMWNKKTRSYAVPNGILYGIRNVHPMFRGYHQHDTQEFLRCFMDQLHEELKEPVWDTTEDKLNSEANGDHSDNRSLHIRRRAASSGASDAPFFARMRRKSPAPSAYSEPRSDGYLRVHTQSESGSGYRAGGRHKRSASFAGTQQYTVHSAHFNGPEASHRSESELSSEADERYETCSSGASDVSDAHPSCLPMKPKEPMSCGGGDGGNGNVRYRSVISDVFDGKLLSSVQCLICDRVSTRVETFQDLSLPIPSREHLSMLRSQQPIISHLAPVHGSQDSWMWWLLSWLRSWFYGPVVSLQDCLAAFFSADELKGDNMYSCSRCNKLRNGVKMSRVVRLPEVLCVHLKRFRHELMFSSKVGARVSFPLHELDMAPYKHKECTSKISRYSLCAVICHSGGAGGGHYTCAARNPRGWFHFDDQCVTPLAPQHVANIEAYVLFYKKVNPQMTVLRQKAAEILGSYAVEQNDIKFYISKQWLNKFNTWAEPGAIDNGDFVCCHGGVRPERAPHVNKIATIIPQALWQFLHENFGGGPACSHVHECSVCAREAERLRVRRQHELTVFYELHQAFQEQECPRAIYAISMHWFRQWQAFVRNKSQQPPPPLDNHGIVTKQDIDGKASYALKAGSDHAQLSEDLWRFFTDIYGGGPEVRLKSPHTQPQPTHQPAPEPQPYQRQLSRKYSESDREEYCTKSTSETNIRQTLYGEALIKNQSLQNINRRYTARTDNILARYKSHEANGNYQDSDEDMGEANNTTRMENGVEDHDANDNPIASTAEIELPNLESISLKSRPRKVKRTVRRRTVK